MTLAELQKKYATPTTESKSNKSYTIQDLANKYSYATKASEYSSFAPELNSFLSDIGTQTQGFGDGFVDKSVFEPYYNNAKNYKTSVGDYINYFESNRDKYDAEQIGSIIDSLKQTDTALGGYLDLADYWNYWDNEAQWTAYNDYEGGKAKYDALMAERQSLVDNPYGEDATEWTGARKGAAYLEWLNDRNAKRDAANKRIAEIDAQTWGDYYGDDSVFPYLKYANAEDFAENSKAVKPEYFDLGLTGADLELWNLQNPDYAPGGKYYDETYYYINNFGNYREGTEAYSPYRKYNQMSEDDVALYNYLYATQGKNVANDFLDKLKLDEKQYYADLQADRDFAKEHPLAAMGLAMTHSGYLTAQAGIDYAAQNINKLLTGKDINYYSTAQAMHEGKGVVQDEVSKMAQNAVPIKILGMDITKMAVSNLFSMADSLSAGALGGVGMFMLSADAGLSAMHTAVQNGASDGEAFLKGLATGIAEYIFETFSIGNLKAMQEAGIGKWKDIVKNVGKSVAVNFTEELATEVANVTYDILLGYDYSNIKGKSAKEIMAQVIEAGVSGAMMGVGFGVAGNIGAAVNYQGFRKDTIKEITDKFVADGMTKADAEKSAKIVFKMMEAAQNAPAQQTTTQPTVSDLARGESATNRAEADNLADDYKTSVNRVILEQSAKYGEAGAEMLNAIWEIQGHRLDAAEYINAMDEAYYAGKNGKEYSFEGHSVEPDVARVMYEAGKQDANVLNNGQQEVYNEINNTETEGNVNGTEGRDVYLRNGSEWNRGQDTGEQLRQLGGRTGENQAGQVTARSKDAGAASLNLKKEKVSSLSLGIKGGTNAKNISLIESGETEAMTKAREAAAERGLKTVFFAGDNLKLYDQKSKKYVYARGAIQGDTIYVRVDHSEFTAEQIAKHEAGHDMINKGEVSIEDVRNRLIADGYDIDNVVDLYEAAYRGAKLSYDELLEEIICDSIADMNIFEGKVEVDTDYIGKVSSAVEQTKTETDSARAPPADSGVKLSQEIDTDYLAAVKRGDMETAQKMVDEAAKAAGYNYHLYHGTNADFTKFDLRKFGGRNGKGEGYGIYLAANRVISAPYGKNIIDAYVKFNRLAEGTKKTLSLSEVKKLVKKACEVEAQKNVADGEYESIAEALKDTWVSNYVYTYDYSSMAQVYSDVAYMLWENNDNDGEIINEMMASSGAHYDYNNALNFYENVLTPVTNIDGFHYIWGNKDGSGEQNDIYLAFNSNQIKSADPVTYDDNGNVIPLPQRFNENENDIRYSLEFSEDSPLLQLEEAKRALKENDAEIKKLRKQLENAKGQTKLTPRPSIRQADINKLAKKIITDHSSTLNATDIAAQVKTLAEMAIRNGVDDVDVSTLARSIASDIVNSASELVDDGLREDYKGIKEYLKKTPLQFSDKSDIADYNLFRKRNFGRLNIRNNGFGVDRAYQELQEMFGKGLFPDGVDAPADQLLHFADLLDRLQDTYENPYDYNLAVATEEVATDILASIQEEQLREVTKTFADKARERLNAVKEKAAQQRNAAVNKVRADRDKKIAELKADFKESKDKARESRKSRELRERIIRHVAALSVKLRNPTDAKHIPESFRATVAKLLSAINLESQYTYDEQGKRRKDNSGTATKRTQAFKQLKQEYLKILGNATIDPDLLGDEGNLQAVIDMEDKPISAMNSEELFLVWKVLAATESALSNYNKLFAQGKFGTVAGIAEALKRDNRGKKTVVESKLRDSVVLSNETPETFFNGLGNAGREIFRMLRNAQDKATLLTAKVKAFTAELEDIKNAKKWEKEIHTVTLGGKQIKISAAQIMELFVLCHRQHALDHIFVGGIRPDTIQSGVRKIAYSDAIRGVTLDEITDAFNSLSAEQKNVALKLQEFASKNLSDMGNEASMQVYGYKKFNEENYWPIRVNKQEVNTTSESETAVPSIANKGWTKATKPNANNSVRLGSIFDTFAQHSAEMVAYSAYLGVSEDVNRVKNFQFFNEMGERTGTVKGIVDTVHGNGGSAWIEQLLRDIAGGNTAAKPSIIPYHLLSKAKATSVGANLSVIVQQPTAMIRAFSMINPKYFVKGALAKDGWKKAVKYSPIAQWKSWGYFDVSSGKTNKTLLFDTNATTDKVVEVSMIPASFMDAMSWGTLWNAVEAEVKAANKNLEVGSKEYYEAVNKRFTEIIDATQVVDGVLQRSANMRSTDGLMQLVTSFMGEPTKQLNMVIQAIQDFNGADEQQKAKAASKLVRTSIVLLVSGLINQAVKSLVNAMRNDDKEKEYWEKWLEAFVGDGTLEGFWKSNVGEMVNPLGYIVGLNDFNSIIRGYDAKRMDMETFAYLWDSIMNFWKTMNGKGKYNFTGASVELLGSISKFAGIPAGNIKRDIHSVISTIAIESNSYVMQYRMEKTLKNIQYSGNKKNFMDILYNAYKDDPDAYEIIYNDLVKSGYDINDIMGAMNDRLKKDQGVTKVTELDRRWMPPAIEKEYNEKLKTLSSSSVWKKADEDDRAKVENIMYNYLSGTDSGKATAEKIEGGKQYGLTDTEYILYKLALEMVDKPNAEGKTGTYTSAEKKEALNMVGLTYSEKNYLLGKYDK